MMKRQLLLRGLIISLSFPVAWLPVNSSLAQTDFQNPLNVEQFQDPLLPNPPVERDLTPLERFKLSEAVDQLHQQARQHYQAGEVEQAFQIWYRELRLRQKLNPVDEVKALGRVGEIAWSDNRSQDVRNIRQRLQEIEATAKEKNNRELIELLAKTYERINVSDRAIALYESLLEDSANPIPFLEKIATLSEQRFNYEKAAQSYQQLLEQSDRASNLSATINYLTSLKEIYEESGNAEQGIAVKKRLVSIHQQQDNEQRLPALLLSLANDYSQTEQLEQADQTYREAFNKAWSQTKYAIASEAVKNLAQMYDNQETFDKALHLYEQLLIVQQRANNAYGLMMTYDRIGEIYQQRDRAQQALTAFENALEWAQRLGYQQDYFQDKIQNLKS